MGRFEDLTAWKLAHQLTMATYRVTSESPKSEQFGLTSQMRRAAYSIAANLAEGTSKRGKREFRRFVDIAIGSLAELKYALVLSRDLGLIPAEEWQLVDSLRDETARVVWGLYRSLGV